MENLAPKFVTIEIASNGYIIQSLTESKYQDKILCSTKRILIRELNTILKNSSQND